MLSHSSIDKELPPLPPSYDEVHDAETTLESYELSNAASWGSRATRPKIASRPPSFASLLGSVDQHGGSNDTKIHGPSWFRRRLKSSSAVSSNSDGHDGVKQPQRYQGWRVSVVVCAATAATVLAINSVLTVWASIRYGNTRGLATIQEGSCQKTKTLSLWLHLAINVLSTILLSASNYCMQCLSSPTREEVDKAHRSRIWLHIGVPSVRNLHQIAWYRIALWWALGLSGVPLHLLYNSAVFSSLAAAEYSVYAASPDLFTNNGVNWSQPIYGSGGSNLQAIKNATNWQRLDNKACIIAYGQPFVSAHGDLVAISTDLNASDPIAYIGGVDKFTFGATRLQSYAWICGEDDHCNINLITNASSWTLQNGSAQTGYYYTTPPYLTVDYCYSNPIEERCRLQFSMVIMGIVIGCNLVKAVCMVLTLLYHKSQPFVTLGDALASFLDHPDPTTENMCLANRYSFARNGDGGTLYAEASSRNEEGEKSVCSNPRNRIGGPSTTLNTLEEEDKFTKKWAHGAKKWQIQSHRWFKGATLRRWVICNALCICTLLAAFGLAIMAVENESLTSKSFSHLWEIGYGTVTSEQMITWNSHTSDSGLILTIVIANAPQALLSFLFLTYNSLYTYMLLADEWNSYAHKRKPLRVTSPVGEQRCTYRLQLPYRYGIPLLVLSGTLHWLVSQSLFLARVTTFDENGVEDAENSISTIGYSSIAIITVITLGFIVVLLGIGMGFRQYKPGVPLVGSCSAAMSAACHRPSEDVDASKKGVMWGVVGVENGIGHCCVTSLEVEPPVEGELYAGWDVDRTNPLGRRKQ